MTTTEQTSLKELLAQRKDLETQIKAAREKEIAETVQLIRELISEFELTPDDIFQTNKKFVAKNLTRNPVAPKYRDPASGATWTGRGKPPLWIAGKDREAFLIATNITSDI